MIPAGSSSDSPAIRPGPTTATGPGRRRNGGRRRPLVGVHHAGLTQAGPAFSHPAPGHGSAHHRRALTARHSQGVATVAELSDARHVQAAPPGGSERKR